MGDVFIQKTAIVCNLHDQGYPSKKCTRDLQMMAGAYVEIAHQAVCYSSCLRSVPPAGLLVIAKRHNQKELWVMGSHRKPYG